MKHLKKFESNDYTSLRGEILDLCSELIDNGIRCEVSPLGSHSARDYFMITISKDTEEGASTSLLKRKSFRPFMRSL